ncbi:MAG: OmpA family protein [Halothiobacillaceae bacterium]|nr:OmpA family protein [Halothiobacillaceae bacterium]
MKKFAIIGSSIVAASLLASTAAFAGVGSPYVYDNSKKVVRDGFKRCVLNGHNPLTPENASEECNPELIKKADAAKPAPAPAPVPVKKTVTLSADTYFDFDKSTLKPAGKKALDELIAELKGMKSVDKILVVGHTDSIGTEAYNQKLSERRAATVKKYLTEGGIDGSKIEAMGKGESDPIADNKTKEGRAKNRRVDVSVDGTVNGK